MAKAGSLCRSFSRMDVESAMKSIPNGKYSSLDKYIVGFCKSTWSIVKEDVIKAVLKFFESGKILGQINATSITLVPKTNCPNSIADYKHISCCNVIYKVISKLDTKIE